MTPQEARKLIGGYATGTLTDAERRALFSAAMHDQKLFDALADEEVLRETLDDPFARQRLLRALEVKKATFWLFRPAPILALSTAALAVLAMVYLRTPAPTPAGSVEVAQTRQEAPAPLVTIPEPTPKPVSTPAATRDPSVIQRADPSPPGRRPPAEPTVADRAVAAPEAPTKETVAAAPPFRAEIQRLQSDGNWVQFGGELSSGDQARIRVFTNESGFVQMSFGGLQTELRPVVTNQSYTFPAPSTSGTVVLSFYRTAPPAASGNVAMQQFRANQPATPLPPARASSVKMAVAGDHTITLRITVR